MTKNCLTFWLLCCIINEYSDFWELYMPRFFVDKNQIGENSVLIKGDDAFHISRSLRMAKGEHITVCDGERFEYECVLTEFSDTVTAEIIERRELSTEPGLKITLWQALPKGDKLDSIIQKSVECGVYEIRLFTSEHCIVKTDAKSEEKKQDRRCKIAAEAAKQSGRGMIPKVYAAVGFDTMLAAAAKADLPVFCYEGDSTKPLGEVLSGFSLEDMEGKTVSVIVGSEGGFSLKEAQKAEDAGMIMTGLGPRILRTETAPIFTLGAIITKFELS